MDYRYQKSKTNLDFTEARDSEWQWHQLGHMQVCTSLQADNHASIPPLSFYRPDALPAAQPTVSKHWWQQLLLNIFNGLFSRTACISRYQKGKTSLDLNEARDDGVWGWQWHQLDYANNLHLASDRWPHQYLITQFLQVGCSSWRPTNSVIALKTDTL